MSRSRAPFVLAALAATALSTSATLAVTFTRTDLASDVPGLAKTTDPNLVNPWGMAPALNGRLFISNAGTGTVTSFDARAGSTESAVPIPSIPAPGGGAASPTGAATNGTTSAFLISSSSVTAPSEVLFATEEGTIVGFSSAVDAARGVTVVDRSGSGAIYKGLAIGFNEGGAFLYATNFHAGTVEVFDSTFRPVSLSSDAFTDPNLPAGFAPFGIAAINGEIYVTFAKQDDEKEDEVAGAGLGLIDVFDTRGKLEKRFVTGGVLNAPWGLAWAPFEGFGNLGNALLVGNFGDGAINAFDFDSGASLGTVNDGAGVPIRIPGLWALQFGLGIAGSSSATLYFTAGIDDEKHGLFGSLKVNAASLPAPEGPSMTDASLTVGTLLSGLEQPTGMAFLGANDLLVLEKASGSVKHVVNGAVVGTALTLPVNSASERGLLGIALDPDFASNHAVYLYWTASKSGTVSSDVVDVPILGNRVDRFTWDPGTGTLTMDRNLLTLRSYQSDPGQPLRGNHDGGKIVFGPDGKLYVQIGDQGRRGQLQNLARGPNARREPDDQFGGPQPDDAHLTGAIFRLNPDGSTPDDNPFVNLSVSDITALEHDLGVSPKQAATLTRNLRKVYSYGHRNGFGLAFDPMTGALWESENGDDAFDEMNRVEAGSNGGWIQVMGPLDRVAEFKEIESSFTAMQGNLPVGATPFDRSSYIPAMQQLRFDPTRLSDTADDARSNFVELPGSHYEDPEFSWKWAVAPAAIGFAGSSLGPAHAGSLFVGESRTFLAGGYLFEFKFDPSRLHFAFDDPKLNDKVDDNEYKFDEGESESLLAGKNFGIVTDIQTGPDGNLYVTSLTKGAVYVIKRK